LRVARPRPGAEEPGDRRSDGTREFAQPTPESVTFDGTANGPDFPRYIHYLVRKARVSPFARTIFIAMGGLYRGVVAMDAMDIPNRITE
jgi:hypothetical protein